VITVAVEDQAGLLARRADDVVLYQAAALAEFDTSAEAEQLRAAAEQVAERRRGAHAAAVAAGITPCPAWWSASTPCLHPLGDGHPGLCFSAAEGGGWARTTSWFAPETVPAPAPHLS
jgi:hypothetical protein